MSKRNIMIYASVMLMALMLAVIFRDGQARSQVIADTHVMENGVITNLQARATGGGGPFDGVVNEISDLEDLVDTAWGQGRLGLHRGHAPIDSILSAFFGIDHAEMHYYMEDENKNLADTSIALGLEPDNLVETLILSFAPYVAQAVENGVISSAEKEQWIGRIREEFHRRVYWDGL